MYNICLSAVDLSPIGYSDLIMDGQLALQDCENMCARYRCVSHPVHTVRSLSFYTHNIVGAWLRFRFIAYTRQIN